jgi:hypothetical protein
VDSSRELIRSKIFWVVITILVALVSAWFGAYLNNQTTMESWNRSISYQQELQETTQQNIAQALYFDVNALQIKLNYSLNQINNTTNDTILYLDDPYYNPNGLYYVFSKDIANFKDTQLSSDLYDFYNRVIQIEDERAYLQQTDNQHFMTGTTVDLSFPLGSEIISTNEDMYANIILANRSAEKIISEFKNDYPSLSQPSQTNYFLPFKTFYIRNTSVREIPSNI